MIRKLVFKNIGCFEHFEADNCQQLMLALADNGGGKTTLARTFEAMFDTHNANLIREGAPQGEIYFEVEVPEGLLKVKQIKVKQTLTQRGSKYDILTPNGLRVVNQPKDYLRSILTGFSLNPLKLVYATDKERIEYLLSVVQVRFTREEIEAIEGGNFAAAAQGFDLEQFDTLVKTKEIERTEQNAKVEATKGLLTKLEQTLPPAPADRQNWIDEVQRLESALADARKSLSRMEQSIEAERAAALAQAQDSFHKKVRDLDARETAEIEDIRKKYATLRGAEQRKLDAAKEQIDFLTRQELSGKTGNCHDEIDILTAQLATAKERASQSVRDEIARQHVEQARANFRGESLEATRRQKLVEDLREMRKRKVSDLGIEGVEIREGRIVVEGKDFATQLNEAEQFKVAFQIVAEAIKDREVRFVVADAGDKLNTRNLQFIFEYADYYGIQVWVTKRDETQKQLRVIPYAQWKAEHSTVNETAAVAV